MEGSVVDALMGLVPPPKRVRYARCGHAGTFDLPRRTLEERWEDGSAWAGVVAEPGWTLFRRTTVELVDGAPGPVSEDVLVGYGTPGLADLGVFRGEELELYAPFQLVLPAEPTVGATWSATHQCGSRQSARSVELRKGESPGELVSVAEIRRPDGVMVLRNRFVPKEGWVGFEALVHAPGRPPVRLWSEGLTVETRKRASVDAEVE